MRDGDKFNNLHVTRNESIHIIIYYIVKTVYDNRKKIILEINNNTLEKRAG